MNESPSPYARGWFAGFVIGVLTSMAMLIGVTFTYCIVTLAGRC